ncbi:MAG: signal peptidase I [Dehalococcoidales bacterium]|nr:signal peptidase I [Dehalococcoidales bacterium]
MKNYLREVLIIVVLAAVIYGLLFFVIQGVPVLGSSMEPNLASHGQRVLVVKAAYWFGHDPERGDIITFKPPEDWPNPKSLPFIKRVIGLPGDTIRIINGKIYLNDSTEPLDEPYIERSFTYSMAKVTIPEGCYFVLGDNRDISEDSHMYGTIFRKSIIGKAWFSYWPFSLWGTVANYHFPD